MAFARSLCSAPLFAALALSACSDSHDGPGDPIDEPRPPGEVAPTNPKDYFQAYRAFSPGPLVLVDTADFTTRIDLGLVEGDMAVLYTGVAAVGAVQHYRPHSAYFVQDGTLKRVSLRRSGSQVPQAVSSADFSDGACSFQLVPKTIGSAVDAQILFSLPDPTQGCDVPTFWRVAVDAGAGVAPSAGPIGSNLVDFRDATGVLTGLLAFDYRTPALRFYDAAFGNPETLATGGGTDNYYVSRQGLQAMIVYDGALRRVGSDGALSGALHPVPATDIVVRGRTDDEFLYFVPHSLSTGAQKVYRVPLDGSAPAQLLWDATDMFDVWIAGFTEASVVLMVRDLAGTRVMLLDRASDGTAAPQPLQDFADGNVWFRTYRAPFLYTSFDIDGVPTAHRLEADETLASEAGSEWVGRQFSLEFPLAFAATAEPPPPIGAFRVNGVVAGQRHLGATLAFVDLASGQATPFAEVTRTESVYLNAHGGIGMGAFVTGAPLSVQRDVFSFDFTEARLERHTDGTAANEFTLTPPLD